MKTPALPSLFSISHLGPVLALGTLLALAVASHAEVFPGETTEWTAAELELQRATRAPAAKLENKSRKPRMPLFVLPDLAVAELEESVITTDAVEESVIKVPYLPPVEGTKIYAGKRTAVIEMKALPQVVSNNYRQAFALTPGLLVAEESTPLVSIGYRGIGSPDRAQFIQTLQDGIPISADPIGYPEAYWTPQLESVNRMEFLRGGSGLMYGPQPAGALNYITAMPRTDRAFGFQQNFTAGSYGLISTYTAADGTVGKWGYHLSFGHRQSDGFRQSNSDFRTDGGRLKLVYQASDDTRWIFGFDGYRQENGEPGGLTSAAFTSNKSLTTRPNDRFTLDRYALSAELQHKFSSRTELSVKTWGAYYDRWSRRQALGALPSAFGATPIGATAAIEHQRFFNFGIEPRIRHDYEAWGGQHTLTGGLHLFLSHSPRQDKITANPTENDGNVLRDAQRDVIYGSAFVENKFTFGRLTITPSFRMELVNQNLTLQNFGAPVIESNNSKLDAQPLFGLGFAYDIGNQSAVYANISQSYRPTTFGQSLIPVAGGSANDAAPGLGWHFEVGVRGTPRSWFTYDTAFFLVDLDNKFGTAGTALTSVGRSINYGWDAAFQLDAIGAWDAAFGTHHSKLLGSLNIYANASILEARLTGGANNGGTPQFAPPYLIRTGLIYSRQSGLKVSFLGTLMARHSASDTFNANFDIPAYTSWDLTAEVPVTKNLTLLAGLNNVFDKQYYSRVTANGIDPGYSRNFYVGGKVNF